MSSPLAVAAVAGVPLADGQERIAIVPANYGVDDLDDGAGDVRHRGAHEDRPRDAAHHRRARARDLLDRAVYVAKATMRGSASCATCATSRDERGDCFAMVVVAKKERNGVLVRA